MAGSDHIEVTSETLGDGVILRPQGEVDLSRAPALRLHISQAQNSSAKRVVIDLAGVTYMDSSGVATLVEAMQVARRKGQKLVLCNLQPKVRSIFEIARLDSVFKICPTQDDAMKA